MGDQRGQLAPDFAGQLYDLGFGGPATQIIEAVAQEGEVLRDAVVHLAGEPVPLLDARKHPHLLEEQGGFEL